LAHGDGPEAQWLPFVGSYRTFLAGAEANPDYMLENLFDLALTA
jgi:hypothetical protein